MSWHLKYKGAVIFTAPSKVDVLVEAAARSLIVRAARNRRLHPHYKIEQDADSGVQLSIEADSQEHTDVPAEEDNEPSSLD